MGNQYFIGEDDFGEFVSNLVAAETVVAPVAKKDKFSFEELESADELRLDYDVTILPPKKVFFPPTQNLLVFEGNKATSCIDPQKKILFGVHFYDVKAIDMLDELFRHPIVDWNYHANRGVTTVIGSSIQNISPRAFFSTASSSLKPKGHDGFLTRIDGGYVYEVFSQKGKELTSHGSFVDASDEQVQAAVSANESVNSQSPERLVVEGKELADKMRATFANSEAWEKQAEMCFACGACNIVCPTCYCFDIQDEWHLDQESCTRCRHWDGCMVNEFAEVSLGGQGTENFRETPGERMRHRIMRKTTYLNERLDDQACVGCGRCSISCVPDIADPVKIVESMLEAAHE